MIKQLNLMTVTISWAAITSSARTIKLLFDSDKNKALKRVKRIIKSIDQTTYTSCPDDALISIPFLPVLQMPENYILPWKGDGSTVLPPSEVLAVDYKSNDLWKAGIIAGSQKAIVNIDYGHGCGLIPLQVLQLLQVSTQPTLDDVLNHFQLLIELMADDTGKKFLQKKETWSHVCVICQNVYEFFDKLPKTAIEEKLIYYRDRPFIWNGKEFITPTNVAKNWKKGGPFLYKLPDIMSLRKNLQEVLNIQENFDIHKLLDTLAEMHQEYNQNPLPHDFHDFIDVLISELVSAKGNCEEREQIILVDQKYILRPSSELYYNDAKFLQIEDKYHFVHKHMTSDKARSFGVKFYRSSFLDNFKGTEFGQREDLTVRIKNILRDYPLTESFIKELLQNSDDAKANRMCVILDKRQHGKETTLSKEWGDDLQGPALLVWNDTDFTDKDLEGIQKLGLGSKRDDDDSIGQFGIGFNVVYHVTDCPSFVSRNNSILCVFDPQCRYVHEADKVHPGRQYRDLNDGFWETMKDLRSSYLQDPIPNQPKYLKTGTLFRYPLRWNEGLAQKSEILEKKVVHTANDMEIKLNSWVLKIKEALLFLNHIAQFEYYVIESKSSKFKLKNKYSVNMSKIALDCRRKYQSHLSQQKKTQKTCVPEVFTYTLTLHSADYQLFPKTNKQEWVIQQGVGDLLKTDQRWQFMDRVLPKHGLAVPLNPKQHFSGKIFCFLPLPINSKLPVHINGQFVLSSNRRALWSGIDGEHSDKINWNSQLVEAVASSYAHFLTELRHHVINESGYCDRKEFYAAVNRYYELFPYWMPSKFNKEKIGNSVSLGEVPSTISSSNTMTQSCTVKKELNLDPQWLTLAKSVFSKLWKMNVEILVVEAYNERIIKPEWHMLHNDTEPFSQVYFQPGPQSQNVLSILRRIGMTLTCASKVLHKHCKEFGSFIAKPGQTFEFYSKFHSKTVSCGFKLDKSTPFKTEQDFAVFLKYIMKKSENNSNFEFFKLPYNLPLLLTADGCIRLFRKHNKVLCSKYSNLFPNSPSAFLHPHLLKLKMSPSYFLQKEEVTFLYVNEIFYANLSSQLLLSEVHDSTIDRSMLISLWNCLTDEEENFYQHQEESVKSWALLPSTSHFLYRSDSSVVPIRDSSGKESDDESRLKIILFNFLSVPSLDNAVHKDTSKYCPELSDYDKVIQVIYNKQKQFNMLENAKLSEEDIDILLCYFSRTSFRHSHTILHQIKSFPIFKTVRGVFTSLLEKCVYLWPKGGFCMAGYEKWALQKNVFLEYNGSWRKLCGTEFSLLGNIPDKKNIYCELVFPHFAELSEAERKQHLEYIKKKLLDDAIFQSKQMQPFAVKFLADLKELECLIHNNTLLNIASFCDHTIQIFTTFPEHFHFLSDDYCSDDWLEFFRKLDLQVKLDFDTFVRLCEQVARGDHPELKKASDVLFSYIFSEAAEPLRCNENKISEIGNIRFVKTLEPRPFSWIKAPCSPPQEFQNIGLTKLNEAILFENVPLVWTVKPLFHLPSITHSMKDDEVLEILIKLGVELIPNPKDVYQNIINISRTSLANPKLFLAYDPALGCYNDSSPADIFDIILKIIQYLYKNNQSELLQQLTDVPCIPVFAAKNKPVLVRPRQVLGSEAASDFAPYLHNVPLQLFGIMEALNVMGVSNKLELRHVNYMLRLMNEFHSGRAISNPNEISRIEKAIFKLYDLLQDKSDSNESDELLQLESLCDLCLPSQVNHYQFKLVPSKKLVFNDTTRFRNLEKCCFSSSLYLLFKIPIRSNNKCIREMDFCLKLPRDIRPIHLSLCVTETLCHADVGSNESPLVSHFTKFGEMFSHILPHVTKIIIDRSFPSCVTKDEITNFLAKLKEILTELNVVAIGSLCVRVTLQGDTESIGVFRVNYSLQRNDKTFTLYVDKEVTAGRSLWKEMAQTLCIEISRALECDLVKFFSCRYALSEILAVQTIEDIQALANEHGYSTINDGDMGADYVPKIGCHIPKPLLILSQDINHIFYEQELVGYEMAVNHVIWAMILNTVKDDIESTKPRLNRYKIKWFESQKHQPIVVSSVYLFKFLSDEEGMETAAAEDGSSELVIENSSSELKCKIDEELKLIWNSYLTNGERKKAIDIMLLMYDPNGESRNKHLYEEALKYLLEQHDELKEPETVRKEDDGCNNESHKDEFPRHERQGGGGEGGGGDGDGDGGGGGVSEAEPEASPEPDEVEAQRWVRQAESDLDAMRILQNYFGKSCISCQVSFMAHEVAEKALKAGVYKLIGINPNSELLMNHNLTNLVSKMSSKKPDQFEKLQNLVEKLGSRVYTRSRFPNCFSKPTAPVDVYIPDEAKRNAEIAEEIYSIIKRIVTNQQSV